MKSKLILVVLLLVLASVAIAPLHAQESPQKLDIEIQRTAVAGQYGLVHLSDLFMLHNNGTTAVSTLDFGFARVYRNNFLYMAAKDQQGNELTLDPDVNQTSPFFWVRAHFAQALEPKGAYNFTVTSVLHDVLLRVSLGYEFNFTAAPVLTQDARLANCTFVAVGGTTFVSLPDSTYRELTVGGYPAITNGYKPWKAYSNDTFYAPFRSISQFFLDLDWAERDISIGMAGTLTVADKIHFHNPSIAISSLTITLPSGASNVMAYDEVGALWTASQNPNPPYEVTVTPRSSQGLRGNENFTLTLTYDLPQSTYIKRLSGWGDYNLTLTLLNNREDFLFKQATVKIIAPSGLTVTGLRTPPQSILSNPILVSGNDRTFTLTDVTNQNNVTFSMGFSYNPFWSAFDTLPWIVGFEVVIVAFALAFRRRRPELEVPVPVEKLREFVGLYDERLALSRELVVMDEDVARGSLVKHEFRRRKKVMDMRLDEVNRSLMQIKTEIRTISTHYDEMIRRIDRAEAEVEASRASLNQVRGQYRAGKTTREAYDSLVRDISRRLDRAEETVETVLITLREEAR